MLPREHVKSAIALTAVLAPRMGARALAAGIAAVFIDADHYLWYAVRFRQLDPRRAFAYFLRASAGRESPPPVATLFHTIEVLGLIAVASRWLRPIRWLLPGLLVHMALDLWDDWQTNHRLDRAYTLFWQWGRSCDRPSSGMHGTS